MSELLALAFLRRAGVSFYETGRETLPCDCACCLGFDTTTGEPTLHIVTCSPEHAEAAEAVLAAWEDPGVLSRVGDLPAHESAALLLAVRIARIA